MMLQAQIFVSKHEIMDTQPMYEFIVEYLIQHDIRGATVFQGRLGYGEDRWLNRPGGLFSFDETPMLVVFVDEDEKVNAVLPELRQLVKNAFIITNEVHEWKRS